MKVLLCGSRDWNHAPTIRAALATLPASTIMVHGAARGADTLGDIIASTEFGFETRPYPADWRTHGKAAGPIRNQQMIDEEHPDLVLAFRRGAVSRGTDDMIRRAKAAGIPVRVYRSPEDEL